MMSTAIRSLVRVTLAAGVVLGLTSVSSDAEQEKWRVVKINLIGDWRSHDPETPERGRDPWTPLDAARLLDRFPEADFRVEARASYPIGNTEYLRKGAHVRELRAVARNIGVPVEGRLCVSIRPDVYYTFPQGHQTCDPSRGGGGCDWEGAMDGRFGEAEIIVKASGMATGGSETGLSDAGADWWTDRWQHRLVVLRPDAAGEESRRVVGNDQNSLEVDRAWSNPPRSTDRYEIRGSFDPSWIQQVPRELHEQTVKRLWVQQRDVCDLPGGCRPPAEPLDPFSPQNTRSWPGSLDRAAVEALSTPTTVPALYGFVRDGQFASEGQEHGELKAPEDPYFRASGTIMRLDDPRYRAWKARYLLYKLSDHGFSPGDSACVIVGYKPGWHAYYDEKTHGPSPDACYVKGSNMWTGPTHICRLDLHRASRFSPAGPFNPTQFGPGVFEQGLSAFFLEMIGTLEQNGYRNPRVITIDTPKHRAGYWTVLSDAVRNHPAMAGDYGRSIEPALPPPLERTTSVDPVAPGSSSSPSAAPSGPAIATPPERGGGSWSIGSPRRSSAHSTTQPQESPRDAPSSSIAQPTPRAVPTPSERSIQQGQDPLRRMSAPQVRQPAAASAPAERPASFGTVRGGVAPDQSVRSLGAGHGSIGRVPEGEARNPERGRLLGAPTGVRKGRIGEDSEADERSSSAKVLERDPCVGEDGEDDEQLRTDDFDPREQGNEPTAALDVDRPAQPADSVSSRREAERRQRCRDARALEVLPQAARNPALPDAASSQPLKAP